MDNNLSVQEELMAHGLLALAKAFLLTTTPDEATKFLIIGLMTVGYLDANPKTKPPSVEDSMEAYKNMIKKLWEDATFGLSGVLAVLQKREPLIAAQVANILVPGLAEVSKEVLSKLPKNPITDTIQ